MEIKIDFKCDKCSNCVLEEIMYNVTVTSIIDQILFDDVSIF